MLRFILVFIVAVDVSRSRLETYRIDRSKVSISGFSSGGYFAVQFHVAFSRNITGAGIVSGGPYYCAEGSEQTALGMCMNNPLLINTSRLVSITHATERAGTIDPVSGMLGDKVMLIAGTGDTVVHLGVVEKLFEYYKNFVHSSDITTEFKIPAEHAMLTDNYGHDCSSLAQPFISNCNYSAAQKLLHHIYGDLIPADVSMAHPNNLHDFDQDEFFASLTTASMDSKGYVYVPSACASKSKVCRLHIALHGCLMSRQLIGSTYVEHAGYNHVAEANDIIVLYPQTHSNLQNPKACFDWWGFTSPAYATKQGPQMAGIKAMLDRLTGTSTATAAMSYTYYFGISIILVLLSLICFLRS